MLRAMNRAALESGVATKQLTVGPLSGEGKGRVGGIRGAMGKLRQGLCGAGGRRQADGGGEQPNPAGLRPLLRPQPDQRRPGAHLRAAAGGHGELARPAPVGARQLGLLVPPLPPPQSPSHPGGGSPPPSPPHPQPGQEEEEEEGGRRLCTCRLTHWCDEFAVLSAGVGGDVALCRAPLPTPGPCLHPTHTQIYGGDGDRSSRWGPMGVTDPPSVPSTHTANSLPKPPPCPV